MTRVRSVTAADLDRVADIERACFGTPWARATLEADLARSWARVWVAEDEGRDGGVVVAFMNAWLVADEVHVQNVATDPAHQRRGHARALLSALMAFARERGASSVLLEVRAGNGAALALYAGFGFERVGLRERYYDDGEDAVLMTARP